MLAGIYAATGRLALLLAIPPGYASPVWPPAGIALAAILLGGDRLWPGIVLGSFLVNIGGGDSSSVETGVRSAAAALGIGLGAALQALAGAFLLRRYGAFPNLLHDEKRVALFFGLAGPVSCLINATLGSSILLWSGQVSRAEYSFSWWTWWIGDMIGVLVFTPLVFAFFDEQWRRGRRRMALGISFFAAFVVVVALFIYAGNREEERIQFAFRQCADRLVQTFEANLDAPTKTVFDIEPLFFKSLEGGKREGMEIHLIDAASQQTLVSLPADAPRHRGSWQGWSYDAPLVFGGRSWTLQFIPTPEYLAMHRSWAAWGMLAAGLFFAGFLEAFFLVTTGRAAKVEQEVDARTLELRRSVAERNLLAAVVESSNDAIITKTLDGKITSWNRGAELMFGYSSAEILGKSIALLTPSGQEDDESQILESIHRGKHIGRYETRRQRKDGCSIDISLTISPIKDLEENIVGMSSIARDITERKRTEKIIQESMNEKDFLLREIHHRVKNNLQIVSSLLNLHKANIKQPDALKAIQQSQTRIRAIAFVHQMLYQSANLREINMSEYLQGVVRHIFETCREPGDRNEVEFDLQEEPLDLDRAIPCGLVVVELVTNCLKHAFPGDRFGKIRVSFRKERNGSYSLSVADNGVGLPEGFNIQHSSSLGLDLVVGLAKQLGGDMVVGRACPGAQISISFR